LVLKFKGTQKPNLDLIQFKASRTSKSEIRQHRLFGNKASSFKNSPVAKVLPIFFLDYLYACLESPPWAFHMEGGNGTPAATLGNTLKDTNGSWYKLFVEHLPNGEKKRLVETIFGGQNWDGRHPVPRMIELNSEELPADCIEVHWDGQKLTGLVQIQKLADQFRKAWELPQPTRLELPKGEGSPPEGSPRQPELLTETQGAKPPDNPPSTALPPPETSFKFSKLFSQIGHALDALQGKCTRPATGNHTRSQRCKRFSRADAPGRLAAIAIFHRRGGQGEGDSNIETIHNAGCRHAYYRGLRVCRLIPLPGFCIPRKTQGGCTHARSAACPTGSDSHAVTAY